MKEIPGFEGKYSATEEGEIFSHLSGKIMKGRKNNRGYLLVKLQHPRKKMWLVHRLVAMAFHGISILDVNHKNGIKDDNSPQNLEWVTALENHRHAINNGLRKPNSAGFRAYIDNKKVAVIGRDKCGVAVASYPSMMAAKQDGYIPQCIGECISGKG